MEDNTPLTFGINRVKLFGVMGACLVGLVLQVLVVLALSPSVWYVFALTGLVFCVFLYIIQTRNNLSLAVTTKGIYLFSATERLMPLLYVPWQEIRTLLPKPHPINAIWIEVNDVDQLLSIQPRLITPEKWEKNFRDKNFEKNNAFLLHTGWLNISNKELFSILNTKLEQYHQQQKLFSALNARLEQQRQQHLQ